jgi:hypothetical protein
MKKTGLIQISFMVTALVVGACSSSDNSGNTPGDGGNGGSTDGASSGSSGGSGSSSGGTDSGSSSGGTDSGSSSGGGTDGGSSQCTTVTPCGGSLVGTWHISSVCLATSGPQSTGCPGETITASVTSATGTVTFDASGNYTSQLAFTLHETAVVPSACLTQGSTTATCNDLQTRFAQTQSSDAGAATVTCTTTSTGCTCDITAPTAPTQSSGTYTTSGNTFTTTSADAGVGNPTAYCVQGNTLYATPSADDAGKSGLETIIATQ